MRHTLFTLLLAIGISYVSKAQFGIPNKDMTDMFKGRTVLVGLAKIDPKEEKKLAKKDPQKLEEMQKSFEARNELRKKMVTKYWPFPNKIEFVDNDQIESVISDKDE